MEYNKKWQKIIKGSIVFFAIVLILFIVGTIMLKYNVEGEQNMPFNLVELLVISSAEGYQEKEDQNNWDLDIYQTNDIYMEIKKNKNYKEKEIIKSLEITNIIVQSPNVGKIKIYRPSSETKTYEYTKEYEIVDNIKLEGSKQTDLKNLKISNQGGRIVFRILNDTGKQYSSNENEIKHDGSLLSKVGLTNEEIKFNISFDIKIELESGVLYDGNIKMELPKGDIINEGTTSLNETNIKNIIFKRN